MAKISYGKILKTHKETIAIFIGVVVILGLVLSLIQPFLYRASVELLIIQKQEPFVDAYTAIKSAERIAKNLSKVIYTTSFFEKVMGSPYKIDLSYFSQKETKRRKQWKKMIETQIAYETGLLKVNVYHKDRLEAQKIAEAIAYVLTTQSQEYHGGGENVSVKIVDQVLTSKYPVRPNIPLNILLSLILGFVFGAIYVILKEVKKIEKEEEPPTHFPKNYQLVPQEKKEILSFEKEKKGESILERKLKGEKEKKEELLLEKRKERKIGGKIITFYNHLKGKEK